MSVRPTSVKGMRDLLPPETAIWARVETTAREVFARYGFEEIRTPIVEETELFVRGVGESSEIVDKQMFTFPDKKGKNLCLRPENTAPVARAFVEHGMKDRTQPLRLFYLGPQFRYERPQKGRYRQFHQIGAEVIGDEGPWSDVEIVLLLVGFLRQLGFADLTVLINTVGDRTCRERYTARLREFLAPHAQTLGPESRRRLAVNPLRILDTKSEAELALLASAPNLRDDLGDESREHFESVLAGLERCSVRYRVEDRLVRGLDYYTRTVFEIVSGELGAQNAIVGGGRYDGLIAEVGGDTVAGIGFAIGLDRLVEILPEDSAARLTTTVETLVVPVGAVSPLEALRVAEGIRAGGRSAQAEISSRSMKNALRRADRFGVRYVVLVGEDELAAGEVTLRDFRTGEQQRLSPIALVEELDRRDREMA